MEKQEIKMNKSKTTNKSKKGLKLPMVNTTDTIRLPSKGVVLLHTKDRKEPPAKMPTEAMKKRSPRKARLLAAFIRDGLSPEERLLKAIYGKEFRGVGLPKEYRTMSAFEFQYARHIKSIADASANKKNKNNKKNNTNKKGNK